MNRLFISLIVVFLLVLTGCNTIQSITGAVVTNITNETINSTNLTILNNNSVTINFTDDSIRCFPYFAGAILETNNTNKTYTHTCVNNELIQFSCLDNTIFSNRTICPFGCESATCLSEPIIQEPVEEEFTITCLFKDQDGDARDGSCQYGSSTCDGDGECEITVTGLELTEITIVDDCDNDQEVLLENQIIAFTCVERRSSGGGGGGSSNPPAEEEEEEEVEDEISFPNYACSVYDKPSYPEIQDTFSLVDLDNNNQTIANYTDSCFDNTTVTEFSCFNGIVGQSNQACEFGCLDGECITSNCQETDRGYDIYTNGSIYQNVSGNISYMRTDVCINNQTLQEFECSDNIPSYQYVNCPDGCVNGSCVFTGGEEVVLPTVTENTTCIFDDGEVSQYGTCILDNVSCFGFGSCSIIATALVGSNITLSDNCENNASIIFDGVNQTSIFSCFDPGKGYECLDSDDGISEFTLGTINQLENNASIFSGTDFCANATTLTEYSCNTNYYTATNVTCGFGCSSGTCILG